MDAFESLSLVRPSLALHNAALNLTFNEEVKKMIKSGKDIAHFAFGQSPFPIPDCLLKHLQEFACNHLYLPMQGIPELRQALSDFHRHYDDIEMSPDNFTVAPGSKELIYLIMNVFNGIILIPSPSWTTYEPQAHLANKQPLIIDTNRESGWKTTPDAIEKVLRSIDRHNSKGYKLLILNNPGNPAGTCYTEFELESLSSCCRKNRILILSDEIYSRLTLSRKHYSVLKCYPEGTIMTNGFSKWASAGGWRLGYAYFPTGLKRLHDAVLNAASHTYTSAPSPMQYTFAKALNQNIDELDEYMNDCTRILKIVGDYCYRELASAGVTGLKSEGGYYFMPDFEVIRRGLAKRGITTGKHLMHALLREADVALLESEIFLRPSTELSCRFCFVCFDGSKALEAIKSSKASEESLDFQEKFMKLYCKTVVDGIQRIKIFVDKHK